MKKILLSMLVWMLFTILLIPIMGIAEAQTVKNCSALQPCTFLWDAVADTDLMEYRVYLSQTSGVYPTIPLVNIPSIQTQAPLGTLPQGTYFVIVTAVDLANNESLPSNELTFFYDAVPTSPIIRFAVTIP